MISVVVGTYGEDSWRQLAQERAIPSAINSPFAEVVHRHVDTTTKGSLAQARNEGASVAMRPWLLFLDADDELAPGHLEAMHAAIVSRMAERFVPQGKPRRELFTPAVQYLRGRQRPAPKIWPRVPIQDGNWMVIGTVIHRQLFLDVGGFRDWELYEDWCLWQRAMKVGAESIEVPDAVYVAHARPNSRNRAPSHREKLRIHDAIRRANYPELYEGEA